MRTDLTDNATGKIITFDPQGWKLDPATGTITATCKGHTISLTPQGCIVLYWQMLHAAGVDQQRRKQPYPQLLN